MGDLCYIKSEDILIHLPGWELMTFPPDYVNPLTALDPYWFRQHVRELPAPPPVAVYVSGERYPLREVVPVPEPSGMIAPLLLVVSVLQRRGRRRGTGSAPATAAPAAAARVAPPPVSRGADQ